MERLRAACYIAGRDRHEFQTGKVLKRILTLLIALLCAGAAIDPAGAQTYPNRPIRVIIPFGPGGLADITMRLLGQKLSERIGEQVVIENRPGAGGIVAATAVAKAPPDGYTLFVLSSGIALSKWLIKDMPFDVATAFTPISTVAYFDLLIVAKADSPLRNVKGMLAEARKDPAKFNIATISPGSTQNVTAELIKSATGIPMTVVTYRNTPEVLTSLLRGDTAVAVDSFTALKSAINGGQIKAIAATGETRSSMQPNVPTLKEGGVNAEVVGWNSLVAPAKTPKEVVDYLNSNIRAVVASDDFKKRILDLGSEAKAGTAEELGNRLNADIKMWGNVIKKAGIQPH
jgi:tripartite-type tricarboxylate transporter receptor subunit TctC